MTAPRQRRTVTWLCLAASAATGLALVASLARGQASSRPAATSATQPSSLPARTQPATTQATRPGLLGRATRAKISSATVQISMLETALSMFEVDTGRYPTAEEGLSALVNQPANCPGWKGPYLPKGVPNDPWENPYVYRYPGTHNTKGFDLSSHGPDGQEGGGDDIDNWTQK
jgi:general secretion pathway protein G